MPRVHTVKAARKDYKDWGIKKGETYYWWKFRFGGKVMSKTYPKQSQLTRSEYYSTLYDLQDEIAATEATSAEDLQSVRDDIIQRLEELRDEQEEKKSNMPDSLQESPTAELLQERYDNLDNAISEFGGVDLDYDGEDDDEEALQEWIREKIDEMSNISFE